MYCPTHLCMVTALDDYHISVGGSSPLKGTNKCLTIKRKKGQNYV